MNNFTNSYQFDETPAYKSLAKDFADAKMAERELVHAKRIIWLLLKQIGEPVVVDSITLLSVPEDAEVVTEQDHAGYFTLTAK